MIRVKYGEMMKDHHSGADAKNWILAILWWDYEDTNNEDIYNAWSRIAFTKISEYHDNLSVEYMDEGHQRIPSYEVLVSSDLGAVRFTKVKSVYQDLNE